jgi:hypothetical protein
LIESRTRGGFRAYQTQKSHGSFRLRGYDVGEYPAGLPATTAQRRRALRQFGKIFKVVTHCVRTSRQGVDEKYPLVPASSQSPAETVSSGQGLKKVDRNYNLIRLSPVCNAEFEFFADEPGRISYGDSANRSDNSLISKFF